ncbi:uncharacterized protein CMU_030490 [Cryptosporidium muris RN66]|uniref:Uncharacterized protein n=1 Tax=Cryptosporidium muris (strain RN66) TaxID=441375 RepID=B6AK19_CRYMR|nr:uncharacterized protein CMU_030490 [Cryptosporidium muris RN66]EEA08560.1 hypothetical protein CMU_030490 [Cryptosporidium muris RN66]|eukprot:XP_002142909.1 hypothetical protein [Cryptosporidium muris RN66]
MKISELLNLLQHFRNELHHQTRYTDDFDSVILETGRILLQHICTSNDTFSSLRLIDKSTKIQQHDKNNPLSYATRRVIQELFALVTASEHCDLLNPQLFVTIISLFRQMCSDCLPSFFLETYNGIISNYNKQYLPLVLELFVERSPLQLLMKNSEQIISWFINGYKGNKKSILELEELDESLLNCKIDYISNNLITLSLFFSCTSAKLVTRTKNEKSAIFSKLNLLREKTDFTNNSEICYLKKANNLLNSLALKRMSFVAILRLITYKRPIDSNDLDQPEFNNIFIERKEIILKIEYTIALWLVGLKPFYPTTDNKILIYEIDGSNSTDIYTLANTANYYCPQHFMHIHIISGLHMWLKKNYLGLCNIDEEINNEDSISEVLREAIIIYTVRVFMQLERMISEMPDYKHLQLNAFHQQYFKNSLLETIPYEVMLIIDSLCEISPLCIKRLTPFVRKLHDRLHMTKSINNLYMETFKFLMKYDSPTSAEIEDWWGTLITDYIDPNTSDSYVVLIFAYWLQSSVISDSLVKINIQAFIIKYSGLFLKLAILHPNHISDNIINLLFHSLNICNLKNELTWISTWKIVLMRMLYMPLLSLFPQVNVQKSPEIISIINSALGVSSENMEISENILNDIKFIINPMRNSSCSIETEKRMFMDLSLRFIINSLWRANTNEKLYTKLVFDTIEKYLDVMFGSLLIKLENKFIDKEYIDLNIIHNLASTITELLDIYFFVYPSGSYHVQNVQRKIAKFITSTMHKCPKLLFEDVLLEKICQYLQSNVNHVSSELIVSLCWTLPEILLEVSDIHMIDCLRGKIEYVLSNFKVLANLYVNIYLENATICETLFYKPDFGQKSSPIETSKKEYELTTIDATFYDGMKFSENSDYFSSDSSFDSVLSYESNYFENLSSDSTSDIGDMIKEYNIYPDEGNREVVFDKSKYATECLYLISIIISGICKIGLKFKQFKQIVIDILKNLIGNLNFKNYYTEVINSHLSESHIENMILAKSILLQKISFNLNMLKQPSSMISNLSL